MEAKNKELPEGTKMLYQVATPVSQISRALWQQPILRALYEKDIERIQRLTPFLVASLGRKFLQEPVLLKTGISHSSVQEN